MLKGAFAPSFYMKNEQSRVIAAAGNANPTSGIPAKNAAQNGMSTIVLVALEAQNSTLYSRHNPPTKPAKQNAIAYAAKTKPTPTLASKLYFDILSPF